MEFLSQVPALALREGPGKQTTFCADVFQPRPPFEEIRNGASWSVSAQAQMEEALKRKACPVSWVALFVDESGMFAVIQFKHRLTLGDAKRGAEAVLNALPEAQRCAIEVGLHPMDELDSERIRAWKTVAVVRPEADEESSDSEEEEETQVFFAPPGTPQPAPTAAPTAAELLKTYEEGRTAKRRRLDDAIVPLSREVVKMACEGSDLALNTAHAPTLIQAWVYLAQQRATVHVASAGERPATLSYIRCHREARRVRLLAEHARKEYEKPGLLAVVRVAVQLATDGSLPGHDGPRARKTEFIRRCQDALLVVQPDAARTVENASTRRLIAKIIGDKNEPEWPVKMCLACSHKDPGWTTTKMVSLPGDPAVERSHCKKCKVPYCFGRTWNGTILVREPAWITRGVMYGKRARN
jgi:hypothetical protein